MTLIGIVERLSDRFDIDKWTRKKATSQLMANQQIWIIISIFNAWCCCLKWIFLSFFLSFACSVAVAVYIPVINSLVAVVSWKRKFNSKRKEKCEQPFVLFFTFPSLSIVFCKWSSSSTRCCYYHTQRLLNIEKINDSIRERRQRQRRWLIYHRSNNRLRSLRRVNWNLDQWNQAWECYQHVEVNRFQN